MSLPAFRSSAHVVSPSSRRRATPPLCLRSALRRRTVYARSHAARVVFPRPLRQQIGCAHALAQRWPRARSKHHGNAKVYRTESRPAGSTQTEEGSGSPRNNSQEGRGEKAAGGVAGPQSVVQQRAAAVEYAASRSTHCAHRKCRLCGEAAKKAAARVKAGMFNKVLS